jgi:hypothetical protein
MSEQPHAWWDIQPDDPKIAQCGECAALVLRTALPRHEEWHAELVERFRECT